MAKKLRVGIIFGGQSGEHEVSIRSANAVIKSINQTKYTAIPIAIDKEGKWLPPHQATGLLAPIAQEHLTPRRENDEDTNVAILGDPSQSGLVSMNANGQSRIAEQLDVIFPVLHGPYGEDGTIQGLLEMANVPYVGCGVLASSCGMDKVTMKALFRDAGLPICKYMWFLRADWRDNRDAILKQVKREIGFPCFVKPANLGSSVGVSKAIDRHSLIQAIDLAARYDRKIIIEEGLDAREIECAILGNDKPTASLPGEYVIYEESAKFLDYTEKYASTGNVDFVVPAPLSKSLTQKIQRMSVTAFKAVDGSGLARVDFFLGRDNKKLIVNELNTLPGLTEVSGYPKMWAASGVKFPQLIDRLIALAFERHRDKSQNQTTR